MRIKLVQHLLILLLAIGIAGTSEIINTDRSSRNIGMEEHEDGGTAHYHLENIFSHLDHARDQVQSVLATAQSTTSHFIEGVKIWSQNPQRQTNIQQTLQGVNKLKTQAVKAFSIAEEQVFAIEWDHLPDKAKDYIREHPYQTALYVINGVVLITPGVLSGPVLSAIGWTRLGPRAGSAASLLHRFASPVLARSPFAYLQSAQMGGYGAPVIDGIIRAGSIVTGLGNAWWSKEKNATAVLNKEEQ
ncbi:hypothetical protein LTR66_009891 [Elasticomyces elasticus]|nr:hypothetical protein LTR66_009891 [Elasticomyces elasticus]